ncbi:MAG: AAA family ATPase, partial [Bacteroidales bacterium]|nr:AAA family ATPase [Bacteroidales bacterium]
MYLQNVYSLTVAQAQKITVGKYYSFSEADYETADGYALDSMYDYAYESYCQDKFEKDLQRQSAGTTVPVASSAPVSKAPPKQNGKQNPLDFFFPSHSIATPKEDLVPPVWAWGNVIRTNRRLQLVGAAKLGKTWFAMALLMCMAQGIPFLGLPTTQCNVLFINPELAEDEYTERAVQIRETYLKDQPDVVKFDMGHHFMELNLRSAPGGAHALVDRIIDLSHSGYKWNLIFIDSVYHYVRGEENSTVAWDLFLDEMTRLELAIGPVSVWWSHHPPKGALADRDAIDVSAGSGLKERFIDTNIVMRPLRVSPDLYKKYHWNEDDSCFLIEFNVRGGHKVKSIRVRFSDGIYYLADTELKYCKIRRGPQDDCPAKSGSDKKVSVAEKKQQNGEKHLQDRFNAIKAIFNAHGTDTLPTSVLFADMAQNVKFANICKNSLSQELKRVVDA